MGMHLIGVHLTGMLSHGRVPYRCASYRHVPHRPVRMPTQHSLLKSKTPPSPHMSHQQHRGLTVRIWMPRSGNLLPELPYHLDGRKEYDQLLERCGFGCCLARLVTGAQDCHSWVFELGPDVPLQEIWQSNEGEAILSRRRVAVPVTSFCS